ncbi:MAG: hypothetical protein MUF31_07865 [Akkermansiaceae bacterium]|jgi:hypothetical protein|nr:hypothetical protein [Akkermansiaceae bacterium]
MPPPLREAPRAVQKKAFHPPSAAYHNLRQALEKGGVRIARDRQFSLGIMPAGYVLELTGNGIAALAPYRKD